MLKKLFLAMFLMIALFAFSNLTKAQTLYFCEDVDSDGYPIVESNVFNISSSGSYLYFLVRLTEAVECTSVRFELYNSYSDGSESYSTTIYQDVEYDWVWFYKQVTFYDAGYYKVYAICNCCEAVLASNTIRIQFRD